MMASIVLSLGIDSVAVDLALADLTKVMDALPRKHGERYRRLERDIEALADGPGEPAVELIGSEFTVSAPDRIAGVLREAY